MVGCSHKSIGQKLLVIILMQFEYASEIAELCHETDNGSAIMSAIDGTIGLFDVS